MVPFALSPTFAFSRFLPEHTAPQVSKGSQRVTTELREKEKQSMARRVPLAFLALAIALTLAGAAAAQRRPSIAIMPAQYFQAGDESAENVTRGLVEQFEAEQYRVIPMDRSRQVFERMGLSPRHNVSDAQILRFGRRLGADLVAHPQLLAVRPWQSREAPARARAVLYLRVLNARTGSPVYTRQAATTFTAASESDTRVLPPAAAADAAAQVSRSYFERVAGSRQELGRPAAR